MARRKTIMVDVDGCLADFMVCWRTMANRLYGVEVYKTGEPQYNNWSQADLTRTQQDHMWELVKDSPDWWLGAPSLLSGSEAEGLRELDRTHNIYYVTARVGETARDQTAEWLSKRLGVSGPTVVISKWKGEVAAAIEADACVDDKAENAWMVSWQSRGRTASYLLDRPFNRGSWDHDKVIRVYSMMEFFEKVR